ncbi:MAG: hypothetical protein M0D55_11220 [Elusimicrobiota bacterium]|nr:MAG: hypothetical protein M0D55_11220 [Elusimicrobiota bacterium]
MKKALELGRLMLVSPQRAAQECESAGALPAALRLYALTLAADAVFQTLKPYDFPDATAAVPAVHQGLSFWIQVALWQPVLMLALIAFAGALLRWMKDGWLPLKVVTSFLWTAIPFILLAAYTMQGSVIGKTQFGFLFLAWLAPTAWLVARVPRADWRPLASLLLAMSVVELAAMLPMAGAVAFRSDAAYKAVAGAAGLWMLFAGARALKFLPPGRPMPRALLPLVFASLLQIGVVFVAFTLGWLPAETLKAIIRV